MNLFNWFKPEPKFKSASELVTFCNKDVNKLATWILRNIWYTNDFAPEDEWQSAERTLSRLKGDCEDFAVLWFAIFNELGWFSRIYCGYPKRGPGHAICITETPNNWGYIYTSNEKMIQVNAKTYDEALKIAMPDMVHFRRTSVSGVTI